jgi:hypothetical protein
LSPVYGKNYILHYREAHHRWVMDTMELGGNISLTGFSGHDFTQLIVVKKIVGQYARKFSDHIPGFSRLSITLKDVHASKVEIIAKAESGSHEYAAECSGYNLFVVLDESLKKLMAQMQKAHEKHLEH